MSRTVKDILFDVKARFEQAGLDTPILEARLLVQHALNMSHEKLLLNSKQVVNDDESKILESIVARRLANEPVSRIIGMRGFWKYDFKITPETLDPRQDSETLIEAALKLAVFPDTILDLGTGSGCLLLSLLGEFPSARGTGLDISAGAVAVALENAARLGFADRADFLAGDWVNYQPAAPFDMVVSNPPYIAESERESLAPEVLKFDPETALFADMEGYGAYRSIITLLPKFLKKGGWVLFEIGYKQAKTVSNMLANAGFGMIQVHQDLAGNDRVVVAKFL